MRDDLLEAQAAIDWPVAQLPAFAKRFEVWLDANIQIEIENVPPPATHNPIVAIEKDPLPFAFNVEMGAYVNTIRSSLDILATALAHRYGIPRPDEAYFPVARSEADFKSGNYKGNEFVKGLPDTPRSFMEALKPYHGGNKTLWFLHQLDIMRKHRRLIVAEVSSLRLTIHGREPPPWDFTPLTTGWIRVNEKTVLGLIRKGAPDYDIKFIPHIAINEPGLITHRPVISTLHHLAHFTELVISVFDNP